MARRRTSRRSRPRILSSTPPLPPPEAIELQVDLKVWLVGSQSFGEAGVVGDTQAIGVEHQVLDGALLCHVHDGPEFGVDRGLTATQLYDVGCCFAAHDRVQHPPYFGKAAVRSVTGAAASVAGRAAQVAAIRDLQHRQATVLLVVRATDRSRTGKPQRTGVWKALGYSLALL